MAAAGYLSVPHYSARAPQRSECREHGVRVVKLPWAETGSRFTALMEG